MSQQSGFVPINYRIAGAILLILGVVILLGAAFSKWIAALSLPPLAFPVGVVLSLVGLYVLWIARRQNGD
ncbi:MAG TPA: hypothetical protein VLL77_06130 [Anaerolineales bacterium]|nr:hypothetical protein [Anaerolineales bacterium]